MSTKAETGLTPASKTLRRALADRTATRPQDWHLVFKARQGMKVAFDALAAQAGAGAAGEVATQLFTCCTAVDPIVAAGLVPVYGDISPATLALDPARAPVGERTRAVVLQHTYGICDAEADGALRDAAHGAGALLVEDCAHCAGRISRDTAGEPVADVSVHSFGVEKMLPTHFGGAVWLNPNMIDASLRERMAKALSALPALDERRERAARLYLNEIRVLNHLPRGLSHALRGGLERAGLFEPAIAEVELEGGLASEPALPGEWVADRALEALERADGAEARRSVAVAEYARALAGIGAGPGEGAWACPGGLASAQPLLRVGAFLESPAKADAAVARLRAAGLYAVPWYRPLLFPGVRKEAAYGLPHGIDEALEALPVTRACSEGAVCLPTDVEPAVARRAVELLLDQ